MEEAPPTEIDNEEVQPTEEVPQEVPQEEETPVENPTKDVKTFWNRLDEVLTELESERPIVTRPYTSSLFQPERISISSANAIPSYPVAGLTVAASGSYFNQLHQASETFSQFTVKFDKSLINVKSIQCLSAIIPNVTLNIPDNEIVFLYYRIPNLLSSVVNPGDPEWDPDIFYNEGDVVAVPPFGANDYYVAIVPNIGIDPEEEIGSEYWYDLTGETLRPNYYRLTEQYVETVNLLPSTLFSPDWTNSPLRTNRTFTSYQDLVDSLNACAAAAGTASIPGDVSFQYNSTLNKIVLVPSSPTTHFYIGAGFMDPNLLYDLSENGQVVFDAKPPYKTLNLRSGFTWNGIFPNFREFENPLTEPALYDSLYWYMRPTDPIFLDVSGIPLVVNNTLTANSYGNLVNTSCVKVYCNITMGSTQDSNGKAGLLSVVPINASNLAVGYYQNNFNNPLTKVPDIISEIQILLVTESGDPFYLPNSAVVTLELYVLYK